MRTRAFHAGLLAVVAALFAALLTSPTPASAAENKTAAAGESTAVSAVTAVSGNAAAAGQGVAPIQERPPRPGAPKLKVKKAHRGPALARLCSGHPAEYGNWVNADPNTNSITKAQLRDCQSVTTCSGDICSITYDAGWTIRLFGKCSPTDCDWGWTAGRLRLSNGQIPGQYNQGFAKRYVWAAMSQYRPGQLWVAVRTDFTDPNRADYETQNWFVRQ
ncbi:hypothetical protein [Actinoplanes sp. NPDC049265]|uniref:hypothetical protein n=1 Tax=Actinoplanes sp. NPDC049265 TaxID=3363902 RepID=UPI0037161108